MGPVIINVGLDFLIRLFIAKFTVRKDLNLNTRFGEVY